ncbi:MAG: flagellar M-ring protein FliF [Thermoleophilaceae bacterium]|nr:flagellar M-ring protein FliF [Thermoleophilaceae bacterium]
MNGIRNLIQNTSPRGKMIAAASVIGVVFIAFLLMKVAAAPSYEQVVSGVDPAETGKITSALDKKGIKYEIRNNGTAIAVDKTQVPQAKMALAGAGLPGKTQPGYELLDKQKLGASDFQQKVNFQRALEGEIASTIEQVDGVNGAQVNLVLADDQLFQDDSQPARASVMLQTDPNVMDANAARGIASLVTSSVKGLKSDSVSITDQTGAILWPKQGSDGAVMSKQQAGQRYSQSMEAQLNALLIQTLGPGKGQVQVNADVNADQVDQQELQYDKKGTPIKSHKEQETLAGKGGSSGGAAGTAGNIPSYAQGTSGTGNSNYNKTTTDAEQAVGKKIIHTRFAAGAVNKQSIAVVLDKSVPPAAATALKNAITAAAGVDPKRGDVVNVSQIAFAKVPVAKKPGATAGALGMAKWVFLGLAMLLFLFFVTRHLRRHESESLEPVWLREIETPTSLAELEGGDSHTMLLDAPVNPVREQVEEIVEQHPERVAQQVRAWLNSGA